MIRPALLLLCLAASACTNDYFVGDSDSDDGTSSPTATSDATTTMATTSSSTTASSTTASSADADSSSANATSSDGSESGSGTSDGSSDDDSSSTTGSNTDPDVVEAHGVPGGLDRVWIYARNDGLDRCVAFVLVWPMTNGEPGLTLPTDWALQEAWASPRASDCDAPMGGPPDASGATSPSGVVSWPAPSGIPCVLDIDVELSFTAQAPWLPASLTVAADDLMVMGC